MRRPTGTDDTLLQRVQRGDSAAFTELVRRHRPWVCHLLRSFTREPEAAEDLAQEVFTRLHRHAASYRGRGTFIPYLKQIALNVGRNHLRRVGATPTIAWDELAQEPSAGDVLETVLAQVLRAEVRAALTQLPTEQREAVLFHYFAGWSVPEIAAQASCPEGTVKSRLFHGVRKIRTTLLNEPDNARSDSE